MKRLLEILFIMTVFPVCLSAQNTGPKIKLKWSYRMSAFGKSYLVGAEDKGTEYNLYICAEPMFVEMSDEIGILVEYREISKFTSFLKQVRNKYAQWNKVSKDNNVKNFYKDLTYKYKGNAFYRHNGQYYKVSNVQLDVWFYVDINGNTRIKISPSRYVADSKRSGGRFKMTFNSIKELDNLIGIVTKSGSKIEEKRAQQAAASSDPVDALFQ